MVNSEDFKIRDSRFEHKGNKDHLDQTGLRGSEIMLHNWNQVARLLVYFPLPPSIGEVIGVKEVLCRLNRI